jgi:hypothetical protein
MWLEDLTVILVKVVGAMVSAKGMANHSKSPKLVLEVVFQALEVPYALDNTLK